MANDDTTAEKDLWLPRVFVAPDRVEVDAVGLHLRPIPPERVGADAEISWWVVDEHVDGPLERALDQFMPRWIAALWPLEKAGRSRGPSG